MNFYFSPIFRKFKSSFFSFSFQMFKFIHFWRKVTLSELSPVHCFHLISLFTLFINFVRKKIVLTFLSNFILYSLIFIFKYTNRRTDQLNMSPKKKNVEIIRQVDI